jgi:hypothetical protein
MLAGVSGEIESLQSTVNAAQRLSGMSSIILPEHPMKDASGHGSSEKQVAALEKAYPEATEVFAERRTGSRDCLYRAW